jgi:hypothetical protein
MIHLRQLQKLKPVGYPKLMKHMEYDTIRAHGHGMYSRFEGIPFSFEVVCVTADFGVFFQDENPHARVGQKSTAR